jgi:hypothetical protein
MSIKHINELPDTELEQWLDKAYYVNGCDAMLTCPVCRRVLTGMHERVPHFLSWLNAKALKLYKTEDPAPTCYECKRYPRCSTEHDSKPCSKFVFHREGDPS